MHINTKVLDDPNQRQFVMNEVISQREVTYEDSTQAMGSPVASKIFGFPWAEKVTVGPQFVIITKQDWVEWDVLEEPLKGLLQEHFDSAPKPLEENPIVEKSNEKKLDSPEAKTIQELIEHQINPSLASHGGYVVLHFQRKN